MNAQQIQSLRLRLGETVEQFGARFGRSKRTVEGWEQGRLPTDFLLLQALVELAEKTSKKSRKKTSRA